MRVPARNRPNDTEGTVDLTRRYLSELGSYPLLSAEQEAWYGYLGAVNSTTLGDGHVLDLGGGDVLPAGARVRVTQVYGLAIVDIVAREHECGYHRKKRVRVRRGGTINC